MKQKQTSIHRRNFLATTTGAGLALSGLSAATPSRAASPSPQSTIANDTIRVGMIGPGGRGTQILKECIEFGSTYKVRVTAVCDIWNQRLEAAAKLVPDIDRGRLLALGFDTVVLHKDRAESYAKQRLDEVERRDLLGRKSALRLGGIPDGTMRRIRIEL